ncbi:MAG TPA: MFS transporter [Thermomicrobiales bacterium]|nr:MFS transporter [Thermomicrobiales bacterium]
MATMFREIRFFKRDIRLFLIYNLLAYVGWGVFQLIFNLYLRELNLREDDMGAFSAAQTLTMAATAATMGPVVGRVGIWRSLVGGMVVFLATSYGLAWAEQPPLLLALSAASGIGLAYLFTGTMPFIIEWVPARQRQTISTLAFAVIGLSGTVGSLLGGALPNVLPVDDLWAFRWTLVAGTLVATLALVPLFSMGTARSGRAEPDPTAAREAEDHAGRRRVRTDVGVFVLIGGLMALGAGMVVPFYNVYLTSLGANAGQIGLVYAAAGLASATIGLAAPALARRWGALAGVAVVRVAPLPLYALLPFAPVLSVAVVAHVVRQTSISMAWPIDSTFIAEVLPPKARAGVFGLRSAAWNLGWAGASLAGGWLIVQRGYGPTFVGYIVFTALAMALFVVYYARHTRVRAGEVTTALPSRASESRAAGVETLASEDGDENGGSRAEGRSRPVVPMGREAATASGTREP